MRKRRLTKKLIDFDFYINVPNEFPSRFQCCIWMNRHIDFEVSQGNGIYTLTLPAPKETTHKVKCVAWIENGTAWIKPLYYYVM